MAINEKIKTTLINKMKTNELEPIHQVAVGVRYIDGVPSIVSSLEGNSDMIDIQNYLFKIYVYNKAYGLAILICDREINAYRETYLYVVYNNFLNLVTSMRLLVDQFMKRGAFERINGILLNDDGIKNRLNIEYNDMCNKLIVKDTINKVIEVGGNELVKYHVPSNHISNLINVNNKPYLAKVKCFGRVNISFSYYVKCINDIAYLLLSISKDSIDSKKIFIIDLNDETSPTKLEDELRKEFSFLVDSKDFLDKVLNQCDLNINTLKRLNNETNNTLDLVTRNLYFRFDRDKSYIIVKSISGIVNTYSNLGDNLDDNTFVAHVIDDLPLITQLELLSVAEVASEGEHDLHQELNI